MILAMARTLTFLMLVLLISGCTSRVELSGLSFEPPAGAKSLDTTPSRAAQYELTPDVILVFYHFGDSGAGSVEANIERWIDQFEPLSMRQHPGGSGSMCSLQFGQGIARMLSHR